MTSPNGRVGAVVVGGDFLGLGIIRSLGRRGIPVCLIDDQYSVARFSRYVNHFVGAPTLREENQTVDFLLDVGHRMGLKGWVLFATRDELVAIFSRHRSILSEYFRVPTPDWDAIKWAWNKWNTYCLATKLDIPSPRTWCPRSLKDLDRIEAKFPLGVKPAVKESFFYATKAKAWRANNREELKSLFQKALSVVGSNEVLIQEIIPGDGTRQFSSCVFYKHGRLIGSMEAQRRRQHPAEFGRAATFVETIELPEITELSVRFLKAINYYGLAEIEFKLDPRDEKYKLLDVNARAWGFHSLGAAAGVDFSYLLFADQVGHSMQECHGRAGIGWMRVVTDVPTSAAGILSGRLNWRSYLQSIKHSQAESVYSREDPLPSLLELVTLPYLAFKKGY